MTSSCTTTKIVQYVLSAVVDDAGRAASGHKLVYVYASACASCLN